MTLLELPRRLAARPPGRRFRAPPRSDGVAAARPRDGGLGRGFVAMRHPNYRRFWFGQIGSLVGAWMQSVALPWLVLQLGGSPLQLGLVMAFMFGPSMFLAPLGGVLADRVDKRRTLIAVNVVAMLQASALFVLAATGVVEIWHVYAAGARGRLRQRGRDAGAPGVRRRARAARRPRQRHRPELDLVQPVARRRSGRGRRHDRRVRRGHQLRRERGELPVGHRRPAAHRRRRAASGAAPRCSYDLDPREPRRGPRLRARHADRAVAARPARRRSRRWR